MIRISPTVNSIIAAATLALLPHAPAQSSRPTQQALDAKMEAQVQKTLANEHAFVGSSIFSSVKKGVVTLSGNVRSEAEKTLASSELADIAGVRTVLNNLTVVLTPQPVTPPPVPLGPSGLKPVSLPGGSILSIRVDDEITTKTAKPNDTFGGTLASAVVFNSYIVIPSGTPVMGRVVDAKAAGHFSGAALSLELVSVRLNQPDGATDASVVTQELSSKAGGRGVNTAEKTGGGAALGAVVGALAGGGAGAGIGALAGGGLGAGSNAITRGKDIDVKPEQLLQFRLAVPFETTVLLRNGRQVIPSAVDPKLTSRSEEHTRTPEQQ
jgi:hypothetical protein